MNSWLDNKQPYRHSPISRQERQYSEATERDHFSGPFEPGGWNGETVV